MQKNILTHNYIDQQTFHQYNLVGVDEAGRGPLAGPVVACAVLTTPSYPLLEKVKDSKKLSMHQREKIFHSVLERQIPFTVGIIDNETIDQMNILQATMQAMNKAIAEMHVYVNAKFPSSFTIDHHLIDGKFPKTFAFTNYTTIIDGDALHYSISLASIIAKVIRDRIMEGYGYLYPQYLFEKHKGYGTKEHYQRINQYGISPIHRKSFLH